MKRLITGFAIGALAVTLFVPQVFAESGVFRDILKGGSQIGGSINPIQNGASVVVKDGKVNGKPVDQYILDEVANGRELSEIVSKLIDGGASAAEVVKAAIAAGISPANAAGVVTKAAPNEAVDIVNAAIEAVPNEAVAITQAVLNVAPDQTAAIKSAAVIAIQSANLDNRQDLSEIVKLAPASKS